MSGTSIIAPSIDPAEALAPFADRDLIPFAEFGEPLGFNRGRRDYAIRKGIVLTTARPGESRAGRPNGAHLITRDEALLILSAVILAGVIGVAVTAMIKTLRNSGATFTTDGLFLPLSGLRAAA